MNYNPFSLYNQPNEKNQAIKYADLGGAVQCKYCMKDIDSADLDNAAE